LLYPNLADENRYMQRRLKKLTDAGYVLRLRALPIPRYGQAPHVFTLAHQGRKYLTEFGVPVPKYHRPSEEKRAAENHPFMTHRLAAVDVLIAAVRLCKEHPVTCPRMLTERELKQVAIRVDVPAGKSVFSQQSRSVAVIPDGWFQLTFDNQEPYSIALELDRSTEDQKVWRQKVAAYAVWAAGPYREAFEATNLTIAVVCPGDQRRRDVLADWTMRELRSRGLEELGDLFLFTASDVVRSVPKDVFFSPVWRQAANASFVSLLEPPAVAREVFFQGV
jgi:hypothetical protein